MLRKVLRVVAALVAVLVLLVAVAWVAWRHPAPAAARGDADALARRMLAAVDADAWARTGAVRWTFFDGGRHLWDRARSYERYEKGDLRVLLDLSTRRGRAWRGAAALSGAERDAALDRAWRRWINDSFWLNPVVKVFDEGVTRSVARDDAGRDALLLTYRSGGVTPGDRYLWILGPDARPTAWRMWVSVLPVPGLEASWESWVRLPTGAWVSTAHRIGPVTQRITEVRAAASLAELERGPDPFAELVATGARNP